MLFNKNLIFRPKASQKPKQAHNQNIGNNALHFMRCFYSLIENMEACEARTKHPKLYSELMIVNVGIRDCDDNEEILAINDKIIDVIMPHIKTEYNKGYEDTIFRFLCGVTAHFMELAVNDLAILAHNKEIVAVHKEVERIKESQKTAFIKNPKKAALEIKRLEEGLTMMIKKAKGKQMRVFRMLKELELPGTKQDKIIEGVKQILKKYES